MKPLHVGLLVAAGAIGGAVLMKLTEHPKPVAPPPIVAQAPATQPPSAAPPAGPEPEATAPAGAAPEPAKRQSPFAAKRPRRPEPETYTRPKSETAIQAQAPPPPAGSANPEPVAPAPEPPQTPPAQSEPEHATPPPPPAPPEPHKVTLNAGTLIPVRLVDGLTTERNVPGDSFTGTLDKALVVDGFVIAERGSRVEGRVVSSDRGGRMSGVASLGVEVTRLHLSDGQTVSLSTDSFERHAEASHRDDAVKVGAGAALGALIGALAGGGKGAAIGAGAGGAAGAGTVVATRGRAVAIPSETRINFRLRSPLVVTERL